jgi:hypothetical protein
MRGSRTIMDSSNCSLASLAVGKMAGWSATCQMACWMGMAGSGLVADNKSLCNWLICNDFFQRDHLLSRGRDNKWLAF